MAENPYKLKQPKSFSVIFFLELWERFGYYAMQSILVFYFVRNLGFSESKAYATYGAFTALLWGFISIGGYIGDKVLGTKRTIYLGAIALFVGYINLAFSNETSVFTALGIIAVGNGIFKANPSSLLSKSYEKGDPRLHSAFTMYYMAINIGTFAALLLSPTISNYFGFKIGFLVSAVGLVLGISNFLVRKKVLEDINSAPDKKKLNIIYLVLVLFGIVIMSAVSGELIKHLAIAHAFLWVFAFCLVVAYLTITFKQEKEIRNRMLVAFVLMLEAVAFYTLYQQMYTSTVFLVIHNVYHKIFNYTLSPLIFQSLNPFWVIVLSPILAMIYKKLGSRDKDLKITSKFVVGICFCSLAFFILFIAHWTADSHGMLQPYWVVLFYLFATSGELFVAALGIAMVAQLIPDKFVGFVMGLWYLTTAVSCVTGAYVASLTAIPKSITDPVKTLPVYSHVYLEIGIGAVVVAVIMLCVKPFLDKHL